MKGEGEKRITDDCNKKPTKINEKKEGVASHLDSSRRGVGEMKANEVLQSRVGKKRTHGTARIRQEEEKRKFFRRNGEERSL